MSICLDCAYWRYSYPNKAGVCTVGPDSLRGQMLPITVASVGDQLYAEHEPGIATVSNATCDNWEPFSDADDIPYIDKDGEENHWSTDDD